MDTSGVGSVMVVDLFHTILNDIQARGKGGVRWVRMHPHN